MLQCRRAAASCSRRSRLHLDTLCPYLMALHSCHIASALPPLLHFVTCAVIPFVQQRDERAARNTQYSLLHALTLITHCFSTCSSLHSHTVRRSASSGHLSHICVAHRYRPCRISLQSTAACSSRTDDTIHNRPYQHPYRAISNNIPVVHHTISCLSTHTRHANHLLSTTAPPCHSCISNRTPSIRSSNTRA